MEVNTMTVTELKKQCKILCYSIKGQSSWMDNSTSIRTDYLSVHVDEFNVRMDISRTTNTVTGEELYNYNFHSCHTLPRLIYLTLKDFYVK